MTRKKIIHRHPRGDYKGLARCREKRRYGNPIDAKLALAYTPKHTRSAKEPVRVYECPHCQGWHLTAKRRDTR